MNIMFNLTSLDYVYIVVVLASTIWATIRGGVYETIATLSWVIAAIAARFVSPFLDGLFQKWFGLTESTVGTLVSSYFVVFFVILLLVGFFNQKLRAKIQASMMNVTDHTLGVIFGIIRGIVLMGAVYWIALWYYSDMPFMPRWVADARTRPIMQLTAQKIDQWFWPGPENKLLMRDIAGTNEAMQIYNNLINPAVSTDQNKKADAPVPNKKPAPVPAPAPTADDDTGYKSSERTALENQLMQIESAARAAEQHAADTDDE
ncbi:CvpA family protein [bacterium]|nr:CvpA family protein [bacterium]